MIPIHSIALAGTSIRNRASLTRACGAAVIEVSVLDLKARCPCGASRFYAPHPPPYEAVLPLTCTDCGHASSYGDLRDLIGDEAMRQAQGSLERLKRSARARGKSR